MKVPVGLYVPVFNGQRFIQSCLGGVFQQTYPVDRIIVIDDGSTDRSVELAESMDVEVLKQPYNMGLSMARRRAVEELQTPLIASLDVDCVPEPDWLEILVSKMKEASVAGIGGKLIEYYSAGTADLWRTRHLAQNWGDDIIENPLFLFGCNTLFRRDALLDVGNYPSDPMFRTNAEDFYISDRLKSKGYRILYIPDAVVYHHRTDSIHSVLRTYWKWHYYAGPKPDSLAGLWRKFKETGHQAKKILRRDIVDRKWKLIPVTLYGVFYQTIFDVCVFLRATWGRNSEARQ